MFRRCLYYIRHGVITYKDMHSNKNFRFLFSYTVNIIIKKKHVKKETYEPIIPLVEKITFGTFMSKFTFTDPCHSSG